MISFESLKQTFRFLIIEVEGQVRLTNRLLTEQKGDLLDKIASKDDYIDNLKALVEKSCFSTLNQGSKASQEEMDGLRAIHVMSVNLERIGDFCVNIARQTRYLSSMAIIQDLGHQEMFVAIEAALSKVLHAFLTKDLLASLHICRAEYQLDRMYKERFDAIMGSLRTGKGIEDLVTALFIFRYLERIGDALLNIGEALLFAIKGEKLKIEQYEALQDTLKDSPFQSSIPELQVRSILGSRSGCRISRIQPKQGDSTQGIFKEGNRKKIRQEYENMREWEAIQPGLVPRVIGYHETDASASMIVEFISGLTLEEILINGNEPILTACTDTLKDMIHRVWNKTRRPGSFPTDTLPQLKARLDAVRQVHPSYHREEQVIGSLLIPSSGQLIDACVAIEESLPSPCQVFIHGDFNVNNVFYEKDEGVVRYIDLYRSKFADYMQDASVFLVSNYRLPVFEPDARRRIDRVIEELFQVFAAFAREVGDRAFDARMALALARSFYTSTRFELNARFSKRMFLSAHYLMESLAGHQGRWEQYSLPKEVLFYK